MHGFLQQTPFLLTADGVDWVQRTLADLPLERRLSQLFNVALFNETPEAIDSILRWQPGAVTRWPKGKVGEVLSVSRQLMEGTAIPLLVSSDLEGGAISSCCMTPMVNQLGMAATGLVDLHAQAIDAAASEASALGINWSFTPVIDINSDFRSAIVATRSFGNDPRTILSFARAHVSAMQRRGIAATAKHWPGEGYDPRDQHLLTTINPLSLDEWSESFEPLYRALIDDGVMSVMSAHIAWPAYARSQGIGGLEAYRPASVSKLLNLGMLRDKLGFNGLIVSDATGMGGLTSWGPRRQVLPELIENGCDMILFADDIAVDIELLIEALEQGRLSMRRVEEALTRILATKAALGLHRTDARAKLFQPEEAQALLSDKTHHEIGNAVASASVTLVKDTRGILPVTPKRYPRIALITEHARSGFAGMDPPPLVVAELLQAQGFEVRSYGPGNLPLVNEVDLVLYVLAQESMLTKSHIFLDWCDLQGPLDGAMRRYWHELPCVLLSFGHPYYLYDAPRMPCVINAYTAIAPVQRAAIRKLVGQERFFGTSPIDPFCSLDDARY